VYKVRVLLFICNTPSARAEFKVLRRPVESAAQSRHSRVQQKVIIADNVQGVFKENQKKLLSPFLKTCVGQGSNGLDLSISYNIIQVLFSGQLAVPRLHFTGATFNRKFPLKSTHEMALQFLPMSFHFHAIVGSHMLVLASHSLPNLFKPAFATRCISRKSRV
jgi:hypothetical protein